MEFELPVLFNGTELAFPCKLYEYGYSSKIEVDIDGTKVMFEPDEERNWRALLSWEDLQANKQLNVELLKVIAETLDAIRK
ncbi:MAG: hypothetical protein NTW29_20960 [Bacteroidetes bacterium]|nr:hypothetical protein [Bacteroidota bacterium]